MDEYEKKLALAKEALDSGSYDKETIEYIFPELAESEDEKTKRMLDIITYKMSQHQPDIFTGEENEWFNDWLKKQGEKIIPLEEIILNVWELGNYWKELTKGVCNTEHGRQLDYIVKHWKEGDYYIKSLKKQGEQKLVSKVKPKFRIGDVIEVKK